MSPKGKLTAIIRQREIVEKNAIKEKTRILKILDQRQIELDKLHNNRSIIEKECHELETTLRCKALIAGDTSLLLASQSLLLLKKDELRQLEEKIIEQNLATDRAKQRLNDSNQELIDARMEKKKVETIAKNREVTKEIKDQIQEHEDFEDNLKLKK